ncbi:MAG: LCCL domain-containing protein [Steroidobacteraceae bacterium]
MIATLGASILAAPQSSAQTWFQPWLGIDADMTAAQCTQPVGGRCAIVCPPSDGQRASVEGTDTYSSYSSVCAAAIHAGVLAPGQPGPVVIVIGAGEKSYVGSERNGVTSLDHGARAGSFTFAKDGTPGIVGWQTLWSHVPAGFTDPVTVTCPSGGDTAGKAWGTDVYTVDSSICVAAVHAGVITAKGGAVTVQRAEGLKQYTATERFGVASRSAGANADAFAVTAARSSRSPTQPPPPGPPPPSQPPAALRAFTLAGFTAIGSASGSAPVAPRTIQTAAWTAIGSAQVSTPISPRTIQVPPWTAVGSAP